MTAQPKHDEYVEVTYLHTNASTVHRVARTVLGALTWPLVWPLAMISKRSSAVFQTVGDIFAIFPFAFGVILRYEFYRFALKRCGHNVVIGFGTVFIYTDVSVGDNVLIGRNNTIHHCDFGDYAMSGNGCDFLSGSKQHNFDDPDLPIALQGGSMKHIRVGEGCWIGTQCVVMDDVGAGSIVTAGSVVAKPVPENVIVLGNPARILPRFPDAG